MVCRTSAQGEASCVDAPVPMGASSSCSLAGKLKNARGAIYEFKSDGSFTVRGTPRGTFTETNGVLTMNDTSGLCAGTPGVYELAWNTDCTSVTWKLASDACRLRAEGGADMAYTREP